MSDAINAQILQMRRLIVRQEQLVANASEIGTVAPVGSALLTIARKNFARHSANLAQSKRVLSELLALVPQMDIESSAPPAVPKRLSPGAKVDKF